jgi:hypothetical protein
MTIAAMMWKAPHAQGGDNDFISSREDPDFGTVASWEPGGCSSASNTINSQRSDPRSVETNALSIFRGQSTVLAQGIANPALVLPASPFLTVPTGMEEDIVIPESEVSPLGEREGCLLFAHPGLEVCDNDVEMKDVGSLEHEVEQFGHLEAQGHKDWLRVDAMLIDIED